MIATCIRKGLLEAIKKMETEVGKSESTSRRYAVADALVRSIQREDSFDGIVEEIQRAADSQIKCFVNTKERALEKAIREAEQSMLTYESLIDSFRKRDDAANRLMMAQGVIERVLPEPDAHSHNVYGQWIRSRGLALAAALGMTNLGGTPQDRLADVIESKEASRAK